MRVNDYLIPDFASYIKDYRACKGLSQAKMANEIGVKPSAYSDWEGGVSRPNTKTIGKAYEYYGNDVVHLADDPKDPLLMRFDKACLRLGLSRSETAAKVGYSTSNIRNWRNGEVKFDEDKFDFVMRRLNETDT